MLFREADYFLYDTPVWTDRATELLREFVVSVSKEKVKIGEEKKRALEKELKRKCRSG